MAKSFKGLGGSEQKPSTDIIKKHKKKIIKQSTSRPQNSSIDEIKTSKPFGSSGEQVNLNKRIKEQEYNDELKRIRSYKRTLQKEGYTFNKNPIPKRPKRITNKSIEKLKKITLEDIVRKGKSDYQKEYTKARSRLTSAVRRAEKQGLIFNGSPIPDKPPYITKNFIDYLNSIDTKEIKQSGVWVDTETGVIKSYEEFEEHRKEVLKEQRKQRKKEKELKEQPPQIEEPEDKEIVSTIYGDYEPEPFTLSDDEVYTMFSQHVIDEYRGYLNGLPEVFSNTLGKFLDNLLQMYSVDDVANALEQMDESIWDYYSRLGYSYEDAVREYSQRLLDFIPELDDSNMPVMNGVPLTKDVIKNNTDFLTQYEYEDLGYVL